MRAKLWCSVYLLTASWLFAVPYYVQPRLPIWIALLAAGSLLAAWAFRSVHVTVTRAGAAFLIPVVLAALLVPHPFNCGLVVAAVGLVCIVASRRAASMPMVTSVVTLKPATCGQFKTGHFGWPET